jgi:Gas vesicle protein
MVTRSPQSSRHVVSAPESSRPLVSAPQTTNLADLLERVLDKGIVIAGDITLFLGGVQLLTLRIRLLVASIDKAQEIGINWWQSDPALSSRAKELTQSEQERNLLKERLDRLERTLLAPPQEADQKHSEAGQRSNAASSYVLDKEGRLIAELRQLARPSPERPSPEQERPLAPERAQEPEAEQIEQPVGGGQFLSQPLQERIAQAMRPVLGVVHLAVQLGIAQTPQPAEQGRPAGRRGAEQPQEDEQNAALAAVLDQEGRVIAELKPLHEEERPQTQERAPQPQAAQPEQPAGGGQLLGRALQEQIAQASRSVLG